MSEEQQQPEPWEYSARITRVIDGDTVEAKISKTQTIDFGFNFKQQLSGSFELRLRLYGIDTPEISGVKKTSEEYALGQAAKEFVVDWLDFNCSKDANGDWMVTLKTHDGRKLDKSKGKYHGRWVAEVWTRPLPDEEPKALHHALIEAGHDKLTRDASE